MKRALVHLNAIRAFEAVARHMSFAKAARELNVTPAAISQQLKVIENHLGVSLFRRTKRAVFLTDAGQAMLPDVRNGFEHIKRGISKLAELKNREVLTVSTSPSFAAKWLIPRLDRFREAHPGIDIRLDTTARLVDFDAEGVDVAIRYGRGNYRGLDVTPLLSEQIFPVCAPALMTDKHPLSIPHDLSRHTLLHDDTLGSTRGFPSWTTWLEAARVRNVSPKAGVHFNSSMLVIQAAVEGQGVALGRSVIVDDDLRAGRLIKPFSLVCALRFGYFIVHPKRAGNLPHVALFKSWILREVKSRLSTSKRSRPMPAHSAFRPRKHTRAGPGK